MCCLSRRPLTIIYATYNDNTNTTECTVLRASVQSRAMRHPGLMEMEMERHSERPAFGSAPQDRWTAAAAGRRTTAEIIP